MKSSNRKPVLIVVAGPNGSGKTSVTGKILHHQWIAKKIHRVYLYDNSIDNEEATLLIRFVNGGIAKRYVERLPEWARQIAEEEG